MSTQQQIQFIGRLSPPADPKFIANLGDRVLNQAEPTARSMRLRTLIVDDEPIARKVLREELETMNDIEVVAEADNGQSALDAIAERRPDLVLLDLQMPVMGGLDVVRKLKNGSGMPAWRPQSVRDDLLMISNSGVTCGLDPMKERLDLIEHLTPRP